MNQRWWSELGGAALDSVIVEALANNRDLRAAAVRVTTARAEARIAGADLSPQLAGNFDASRSRQNIGAGGAAPGGGAAGGGGAPVAFRSNNFGLSLNLSWEVDLWGRIGSTVSAAYADLQAQQADFAGAQLSLAAQTARVWFALTEARLQLDLAQATVKSFKETARVASDRVDVGVQAPNDKYLALANLASAEALAQQRNETLRRTKRQLEVLLGRYPEGLVEGTETLPTPPADPPAGLPAELIRRRPDLVFAERRLAGSLERIDAAQAALYPRLSLTASGGTQSNEFENLLDSDYLIWTIAGNIMQPIFQGGRLVARVDSAEGRAWEAAEVFAQSALTAYQEVESALAVERVLELRELALQRGVNAASNAARVAGNRYNQGVGSFLNVLEGQRRELDTRGQLISARRARLDNRIDLYLALGGGFPVPQPENEERLRFYSPTEVR